MLRSGWQWLPPTAPRPGSPLASAWAASARIIFAAPQTPTIPGTLTRPDDRAIEVKISQPLAQAAGFGDAGVKTLVAETVGFLMDQHLGLGECGHQLLFHLIGDV